MIELSQNPGVLFRSAMAWALGCIADERGIPALQCLSKDPSVIVRKRALRSLLALQPEEAVAANSKTPGHKALNQEESEPWFAPLL
jgi:HEAT repeat protein